MFVSQTRLMDWDWLIYGENYLDVSANSYEVEDIADSVPYSFWHPIQLDLFELEDVPF